MKRITDKTYLFVVFMLLVALLVFHALFKKELKSDDFEALRYHFQQRDQYIGCYAPDFELSDMQGHRFRLSDALSNRVVVLNFFTTWCGPCRSEMKELEYFCQQMQGRPLVFYAVNVGEGWAAVEQLFKDEDVKLPVLLDEEKEVAARYRIESFPTTLIIMPGGQIMMYESGAIANVDVSLLPQVRPYLRILERDEYVEFPLDQYFEEVEGWLPEREGENEEDTTNAVPGSAEEVSS